MTEASPEKVTSKDKTNICFEKAFSRLENILERMNSGEASLDESLKLFEEANGLIVQCNKRLTDAEGKVEMLIKNRSGDLTLGSDLKPSTTDFISGTHSDNF